MQPEIKKSAFMKFVRNRKFVKRGYSHLKPKSKESSAFATAKPSPSIGAYLVPAGCNDQVADELVPF